MDKQIILRADDETLTALERIKAHLAKKRLEQLSTSECIRYLIKKAALDISE